MQKQWFYLFTKYDLNDVQFLYLTLQVGKENVNTALSLIGYDKDLEAAMQYVFGSAFVCKDMTSAKKVTFDERVQKRSVTLGGDSFDPSGTLSGGTNWCNQIKESTR